MAAITAESVKTNLEIARDQQQASANMITGSDLALSNQMKDASAQTSNAIAVNRHHAYLTIAQGGRQYQEDRAGLAKINSTSDLSTEFLANCLYKSIQQLANQFKHHPSGSTLSAFIISNKTVIVGNVGDSRIIFIGKSNNQYHCQRLSWDHSPLQQQEFDRITQSGGEVIKSDTYRLNGILSLSRALGDAGIGPGLSFEPTMTWFDTKKYSHNYILACTDGITSHVHENDIAKLFSKKASINSITEWLQQLALQRGSIDNKTVLLTPIKPSQPKNDILIGFVADGHGGDTVSTLIKQKFFDVFLAEIQKPFNKNNATKIDILF